MKRSLRLLSMLMAVICLFVFSLFQPIYGITTQVKADSYLDKSIENYNAVWDDTGSQELEYSPIIGELTELRDEDVKQFRRADGAIELVMYPYAVHYEKNGQWEDIDNTIIQTTNEAGQTVYVNTSSDFQVEFGSQINSINITYQGETLSITPVSEQTLKANVINTTSSRSGITDEDQDDLWRFPGELSGSISYSAGGLKSNDNADSLEYRIIGKSLSEFITLASRPDTAPIYRYEIESSLIPILSGNTVELVNENEETILVIDAPNMTDANGVECFDFTVSLISDGDDYIYTMAPDYDWLNDENRVYPVVIDPDVKPEYRGSISDTIHFLDIIKEQITARRSTHIGYAASGTRKP